MFFAFLVLLKLIFVFSLYFLSLIDLTNHTQASFQKSHTMSNRIPKRPSNLIEDLPLAIRWTFKIFTVWTEVNPAGDWEMEWPVEMQKRRKKIMHVSHIVILRRKGGREETREANGVPHPLGRSVGEYFLRSFTGSVYILHTHRSALNWLWTCPVWFRLLLEAMCLPLTLDINCRLLGKKSK